jgi:hypothetical protein
MIYIATTTINRPTKALKLFSKKNNCKLIVALDKKTPEFKLKNSIILTTNYQEKKWHRLSKLIGWNSIQRRNFAILKAYEMSKNDKNALIVLIDDDNIPYPDYFNEIYVNRKIKINEIFINKKYFDPIGYTNHKDLWHRGYPLEFIHNRKYKKLGKKTIIPDVQANFWNGDPDIDAICRIIKHPECNFKNKFFPFFSKKISPFNSQNTILNRKIIKDYFLFPHIGRMDDIWASYYVLSKGYKVVYGKPTVYQKRNVHNLIKDFEGEVIGYTKNKILLENLHRNPENIHTFLPKNSSLAFQEWQRIITNI